MERRKSRGGGKKEEAGEGEGEEEGREIVMAKNEERKGKLDVIREGKRKS